MTEKEIVKALSTDKKIVGKAIREAAEELPSLKAKFHNGALFRSAELSKEEVELVYRKLGCNEIQIILMKENFKEVPADIYEIKGTHKFLEEYKKNQDIKCCNTCKELVGKVGCYNMPQPYCKVYEKYLASFHAKVYEDWCSSYCKINLTQPRIWYKECAPSNLNMYGKTDTVNGIKKSLFKSERSDPKTVTLVNQVGFD